VRFLVQKRLDATLETFLRERRPWTPELAGRLTDLMLALSRAGFVHHDIKGDNVMLCDAEQRWYVIDFATVYCRELHGPYDLVVPEIKDDFYGWPLLNPAPHQIGFWDSVSLAYTIAYHYETQRYPGDESLWELFVDPVRQLYVERVSRVMNAANEITPLWYFSEMSKSYARSDDGPEHFPFFSYEASDTAGDDASAETEHYSSNDDESEDGRDAGVGASMRRHVSSVRTPPAKRRRAD
jgi:hypothetical protein